MADNKTIQIGVRAIVPSKEGIVVVEHHEKADEPSFYVLPGGGIINGESIFEGAKREVAEETHLDIVPERLVYLREVKAGTVSGIEFYVLCRPVAGVPFLGHDPERSPDQQVIKSVKIASDQELISNRFYPEELRDIIANDLYNQFPKFRNLGVHLFQ